MPRAKKHLITKLVTCLVAIVGGLLLGLLVKHNQIILAAIDLIVTFGIALWLIIVAEQLEDE